MQSGNDIRRQGGDESGGRSYPNCNDRPEPCPVGLVRTLEEQKRADNWTSWCFTVELEAAVEAERKVWKRRSEPRLNRLRPVSALSTGAPSALTGECFEFWTGPSISRPLTLKRCAPALAVRQAWPKGGAGARWSAASRRTMAQTAFAWPDQTSYSSSNATYQVNSRY